jgi:hypothetical protein
MKGDPPGQELHEDMERGRSFRKIGFIVIGNRGVSPSRSFRQISIVRSPMQRCGCPEGIPFRIHVRSIRCRNCLQGSHLTERFFFWISCRSHRLPRHRASIHGMGRSQLLQRAEIGVGAVHRSSKPMTIETALSFFCLFPFTPASIGPCQLILHLSVRLRETMSQPSCTS